MDQFETLLFIVQYFNLIYNIFVAPKHVLLKLKCYRYCRSLVYFFRILIYDVYCHLGNATSCDLAEA
jgi:uncharacterized protein YebE (UPF0316 family)